MSFQLVGECARSQGCTGGLALNLHLSISNDAIVCVVKVTFMLKFDYDRRT